MPESVNRERAIFIDNDGQTYPVTDWYDDDGNLCDPEVAVMAVAGKVGIRPELTA